MFEQNRKGVKVGWRKLLDIELHDLYSLLDKLVTKLKGNSDNREEIHRQHRG
jgi:pullulanase/glycogen debranching enzyme